MLISRGAEALIAIDTPLNHPFTVPVVAIGGHRSIDGVTNLILDHRFAAELVLTHLQALGHRRIAFVRGQSFSEDAGDRWRCIVQVAGELGISIRPDLTVQLDRDVSSPELGYPVVQHLLQDSGMQVPADVSVIGFDDIKAAEFNNPRLTTIRQPLANMGRMAAQSVLNRIHGRERFRKQIIVEPELIVRESSQAIQPGNQPLRKANKLPR